MKGINMPEQQEKRLKRAKQLYMGDMSLAEIGKRTKAKQTTVKRWVTYYGWSKEREELKKASVNPEIATKELETAYKLYAAAVDERAAMVDKWVSARRASLDPANVLSYTGKYSVADSYERERFCEGIRDICSVIAIAKKEIKQGRSKAQVQPFDNTNKQVHLAVIDNDNDLEPRSLSGGA